ncbi:MAG: alanine--tRNA ligase [Thiohalomonadales bacterium]
MKSAELRKKFLDYFGHREHEIIASSSLVPGNDPTLLFTNAGMVQFKDVFLGAEKRAYNRAATSQRCVRAGGKHNDLENVGYTARHHTFFEMLGNFSFGDYFKEEAILYAWEFLTVELKLPPERLWVTVYDEDDHAAGIWLKEIGIDPGRFSRIGAKDNFWSMGDTGPCGPCSEIFYDHGKEVPGGPPGSPDEDGDRYIEIWNLVFMQYDRDKKGQLTPLPRPSVDTGMGLERLAAIMQGVHNNYDIDLFKVLIQAAATLLSCDDLNEKSLRVIADHIRACSFLIVDGVVPSNEGRGYVLRRIIRRAIRHGHKLGMKEAFFYKLVKPLAEEMGAAYPELDRELANVSKQLKQEEQRFAETVEQGLEILEQQIRNLSGKEIPGEVVFKLYDTYGFPVDLTADVAREKGLSVDIDGFEAAMQDQRERARAASQFAGESVDQIDIDATTEFTGYDHNAASAHIVALFVNRQSSNKEKNHYEPATELKEGEKGFVVLDQSPFYAESGGQVGDQGCLTTTSSLFRVQDTQKNKTAFLHYGIVETGSFKLKEKLTGSINENERYAIAYNHSATHLMHAALREILGEHVTQKGSLVDAARLRFDFSHYEAVTPTEIAQIEQLVNEKIRENLTVETDIMAHADAIKSGAMALFGEKYGDKVRVLRMGEFSVELCGGTHVARTGEIGVFKIVSEQGVAAGVRRIEALTGPGALDWVAQQSEQVNGIAGLLKTTPEKLLEKVEQTLSRNRQLEKELEHLKMKLAHQQGQDLVSQAIDIDGIKVLAVRLDSIDAKTLRETADQLKNKLGSSVVVLGTVNDEKVSLVAGVSKDQVKRIAAGATVNAVAQQVGGKGGGRPDMAMAGGNDPSSLDAALKSVPEWVRQQLQATDVVS